MKEYFKCKHCYAIVEKRRIARHHTEAHFDVSHEVYLDTFFDLGRPLLKCDCCSIKLDAQRLMKHRPRAHPNKDNTFLKYTLPLLRYMDSSRLKSVVPRALDDNVIVLSSDSDSEEKEDELPKKTGPSLVDAVIQSGDDEAKQSEAIIRNPTSTFNIPGLTKLSNEEQKPCDKSTNTEKKVFNDVASQVSMQTTQYPYTPPRKLPRIEIDEDNCSELVFFL